MNLNTSKPTRLKNYPQARKERKFLDFQPFINKMQTLPKMQDASSELAKRLV
jgi:hypothetical protein